MLNLLGSAAIKYAPLSLLYTAILASFIILTAYGKVDVSATITD